MWHHNIISNWDFPIVQLIYKGAEEMPGSVASGTHCMKTAAKRLFLINLGRQTASVSHYATFQCRAPHAEPSYKSRRDTPQYGAHQLTKQPWHALPGHITTLYVYWTSTIVQYIRAPVKTPCTYLFIVTKCVLQIYPIYGLQGTPVLNPGIYT